MQFDNAELKLFFRNTVRDCILNAFAGDPVVGVFSPSVQNTLYLAQKDVLEKIPQMSHIETALPNKHYTVIDFSNFNQMGKIPNDEVFLPTEQPAGHIRAVLGRKSLLPNMFSSKVKAKSKL